MFGWKIHPYMDEYYLALTTPVVSKQQMLPKKPGAINGALQRKDESITAPRVVVRVADLDRTLKQAVAAGGKLKQPKTEVPDILWYAVIIDSEGNDLGLAQYMRK